ncbi:MAG: IPT/TIG domain-containing protein [Bacteroidetes bacterium]|nr:IPT/TIG domain-containing protein [Bacteroidota bacterium]MBU2584446.1 IPT/TIG domain-containing protein [Bacteroidota bacterium]
MKKKIYKIIAITSFILAFFFLVGCSEDITPSLTELSPEGLPTPVITSISPPNQALAGVTLLTISGSNFSSTLKNNLVYFNGKPGTVLSATTTQLAVTPPNVVSDTVLVKIAVLHSDKFSNTYQYKLVSPWEVYYPFDPIAEKAYGIIEGNDNNLLVNLYDIGIWKITPEKQKSLYVPKGNTQKWDNFRFGPANELYGVRSARGVWKIVENVAPASPWATPTAGTLVALEFDNLQNLWVLNASNTIFRFKQDKTIASFPFTGVLRAIRRFNNALYIGATKDSIEGVWKIPILPNGDLGTEEFYFDITDVKLGAKVTAIAFAADGDLIIGTDKGPNPILVVKPDKSYKELYPGVIGANSVISMYWPSKGTSLFFVRGEEKSADNKITVSQTVIKVEMERSGAPYYGQ